MLLIFLQPVKHLKPEHLPLPHMYILEYGKTEMDGCLFAIHYM
jgi:hypothetical protein